MQSVVNPNGQEVLVPAMKVVFKEEKFDDKQGPREATDEHTIVVLALATLMKCGQVVFDPILTAKEGGRLEIKPSCNKYFLF